MEGVLHTCRYIVMNNIIIHSSFMAKIAFITNNYIKKHLQYKILQEIVCYHTIYTQRNLCGEALALQLLERMPAFEPKHR